MHPMYHPLFVQFLTYFNGNQDFFECHEVLEEYWKEIAPGDKKHPLTGWIQLATGLYHWRRENYTGAKRILVKANNTLVQSRQTEFLQLINSNLLLNDLEQAITKVSSQEAFAAFQVEITDVTLFRTVQEETAKLPPTNYNYLLHKHMLRDRSDILQAREVKRRSRH